MERTPRERQQAINVACGYGFLCWGLITLGWVIGIVSIEALAFIWLFAGAAGFFGLLRTLTVRHPRLWILPTATLLYLAGVLLILYRRINLGVTPLELIVVSGVVYSGGMWPFIRLMVRDDFAQAVPAWLCRECGYPLVGLGEPACPECGTLFDPEKVPDAIGPRDAAQWQTSSLEHPQEEPNE